MQVMEEFRASDEPIRSIKIDTRRNRILVAGDDGEIRFYRRGFNGAERLFAIDWGFAEVERMEYVAIRDHLAIIYAGETAIRTIDLDQLENQLIDLNVLPGHKENRRLTVATESP